MRYRLAPLLPVALVISASVAACSGSGVNTAPPTTHQQHEATRSSASARHGVAIHPAPPKGFIGGTWSSAAAGGASQLEPVTSDSGDDRRAQGVEAASKIWYLAQNTSGDPTTYAVGSFSAAHPGKVTVTKLPNGLQDQGMRLAVVDDHAVLVGNGTVAAFDPETGAVAHKGTDRATTWETGENVTTPTGKMATAQNPAVLTDARSGPQLTFNPSTGSWSAGPKPSHGGAVIASIGATPVEWVGRQNDTAATKPGSVRPEEPEST